jgi:hypothetical protein
MKFNIRRECPSKSILSRQITEGAGGLKSRLDPVSGEIFRVYSYATIEVEGERWAVTEERGYVREF